MATINRFARKTIIFAVFRPEHAPKTLWLSSDEHGGPVLCILVEKQICVKPEDSTRVTSPVDQSLSLVFRWGVFQLGGKIAAFPEIRILGEVWIH